MAIKGNGKTIQWIRDHVSYEHDDWCLMWPFYRLRGYGSFGYLGKSYYAHRFMCDLAHGSPPSSKHQAAHSCGRGDEGCVNPRHLSWKTKSENQLDCRQHGTQAKHNSGNRGRLTREQAEEIRLLKGVKTQLQISQDYGVSESTVSDIWLNRTWTRPSKIVHWTSEDDEKIKDGMRRGLSFATIAGEIGKTIGAVTSRAYRLGLRAGDIAQPGHHT
jgi:hypothetical protein